jgi:hypothetical protein
MKNLELAQCVDHLQDENCKLREVLSWLSSQEPQLGVLIASYKHFDGWALGYDKFGESGGEREGKFGNVPVPPQPTPKDKFASKPNQPREKPSEKASENLSEKPSGKPSEKPCEESHPKPKPRPIHFHSEFCGKDGHKIEFCYKRKREARMAKEWANKDRYHPSHGVPEPRMPLPKGKGFVHKVLAWGDERSHSQGGGLERAVRLAWLGGQTGLAQGRAVRPAWLGGQTDHPQISGQFGFRGRGAGGFSSFGHDTGGRRFESGGVGFAGRSPPRDQYEFGRGHSFESQRGYGPRFPFRGTRTPSVRREWFYHGGSRFDSFDKMDRSFDRRGRMDVANPTFEEMARHWFETFGTNPSVESFSRSRSLF